MTASAPGPVENALLVGIQSTVLSAISNAANDSNWNGNLQVLVRGGFRNGTTEFSCRINTVDLDASGNVRFGGTSTRANVFTP